MVNVDSILLEIGDFGPYQRRIYFLLCLPIIFVGASNLAYVFIAASPEYRCLVPKCDLSLSSPVYDTSFLNFTIPYNEKSLNWDKCYRYQRLNNKDSCLPEDYSANITVECPEGKVFAKDIYLTTVVTEFNLTCEDAWKSNMVQTVYFGGILFGSLTSGMVADAIGRRLILIIGIVSLAATGINIALVAGLTTLNVIRFLNAMAAAAVFQTAFVLGMEFVGPDKRVMCGVLGEYFYAFGEVLLGLLAWWLKSWRMTQLVISVPVSCFIFYWWFIPESPRWLQAQGRNQEVMIVLEKVARGNGKTIPPNLLEGNNDETSADIDVVTAHAKTVTMLDILRTPLLCSRIFAMFFIWIVTTLVYFGLSLNASDLGSGDSSSRPYVDFVLTSLVEFPGYTLAWIGMSMWGRRGSLAVSLVLAGISCAVAGFVSEYSQDYVLIPALFGKCFITCAFAIIYVFASEIFPTAVRGTVVGLCSTFARIGAMLAPFSSRLALIYGPLPMIVFGGLSFIAGILNMIMPETLKTELPETLEDALHLGRSHTLRGDELGTPEEEEHLLNESDEQNDDDSHVACKYSVDVHQEDLDGEPDLPSV